MAPSIFGISIEFDVRNTNKISMNTKSERDHSYVTIATTLGPELIQGCHIWVFWAYFGDILKDEEFLKVTNSPDSGLYVNPLFLM